MARGPVAAPDQEDGVGLVGGRGRGRGLSAGRRGRATGRGGSNIGRAPVSDHVPASGVAACRVAAAGAEPLDRRRGVSRRVPAAGAETSARRGRVARQVPAAGRGAIPRPSGRGVRGRVPVRGADSWHPASAVHVFVPGRTADPGHDAASVHVSIPGRAAGPGYATAPRRASVPGIARRYVPCQPVGFPPRSRTSDGWFPFLSSTVAAVNRRKRKMCVEFRRARYEEHVVDGPLPKDWHGFSVYVSSEVTGVDRNRRKKRKVSIKLLRPGCEEIVVQGPLPKDWQGFSVKFAESLKGCYADRSYYGPPDFLCQYCGASFWFAECSKSRSSWTQRKMVYNRCCKGAKVYIPPFKDPPAYLQELLRFDGTSRAKKFIRTIREYNCMFAFTSMGATIERSFGGSRGPKIFKISGQVSHRIGSLVPSGDDTPKFAELYIHDPANEIKHRMNAINLDDKPTGGVDESIVVGLRDMLNEFNPLVQTFREASKMIEDRGDEPIEDISIRIIGPSEGVSPQFS